jgi:hypothetical protein
VFPFLAWSRRAEPLVKQSNQRITVNNIKLIIIRKSMQNFLFLTTHDYQSVSTVIFLSLLMFFCCFVGRGGRRWGEGQTPTDSTSSQETSRVSLARSRCFGRGPSSVSAMTMRFMLDAGTNPTLAQLDDDGGSRGATCRHGEAC